MPNRPAAASVAGLDTSLTWIAYESDSADGLHVFHNGQAILTGSIESISVDIDTEKGTLTAILVRKEGGSLALFPGAVEIIAKGKRISLSALEADNFDGLYFGIGLREDGTSDQVTGVKSLRVVLTAGLASAKLVWNDDGAEEAIF
jgi:hypothetical protein